MNENNNFGNAAGISPEKMAFLNAMMEEMNGKNQNQMLSFLTSINSQAGEKGIQFSDEETELLVQALTANMSPAERKRVELLRRMSKMLGNKPSKKST